MRGNIQLWQKMIVSDIYKRFLGLESSADHMKLNEHWILIQWRWKYLDQYCLNENSNYFFCMLWKFRASCSLFKDDSSSFQLFFVLRPKLVLMVLKGFLIPTQRPRKHYQYSLGKCLSNFFVCLCDFWSWFWRFSSYMTALS